MEKLLTLKEVLEITRVTYPTIRRWLNTGTFPEPIGRRKKLLWVQSRIEEWMNQQSMPIPIPEVTTPRKQRQVEKSYMERQEAARKVLDSHRKAK